MASCFARNASNSACRVWICDCVVSSLLVRDLLSMTERLECIVLFLLVLVFFFLTLLSFLSLILFSFLPLILLSFLPLIILFLL